MRGEVVVTSFDGIPLSVGVQRHGGGGKFPGRKMERKKSDLEWLYEG